MNNLQHRRKENNKKTRKDYGIILGMSQGKASHKLKKKIMFHFVQMANKDICYRCNGKIEHVDELSVEHKIPWKKADNPIEAFWSMDNIAFSHMICNTSYGNGEKKLSEEHKRKIGEANKISKLGSKYSDEHRANMSKSGIGKIISERQRKQISDFHMGKRKNKKTGKWTFPSKEKLR